MWDVPWFVGGGAIHSPEVARLLAFASTGGAEGIVTPGDLKVVPLATPGTSVRVLAGAALILNRAAGGTQQTYVARNVSEEIVGVQSTGAGSGRSDMVIAQIRDPFMPGETWPDPADVTKGPYVFTTLIPNVGAGATTPPAGVSGIALARIDLPGNTSVVQASMIKDLRALARPRSDRQLMSQTTPYPIRLLSSSYIPWPGWSPTLYCPPWATFISCLITLQGIGMSNEPADGELRGRIRGPAGDFQISGPLRYDIDPGGYGGGHREGFVISVSGEIPASARGQNIQLFLDGLKYSGSPGSIGSNENSHMAFDVQFYERAV